MKCDCKDWETGVEYFAVNWSRLFIDLQLPPILPLIDMCPRLNSAFHQVLVIGSTSNTQSAWNNNLIHYSVDSIKFHDR